MTELSEMKDCLHRVERVGEIAAKYMPQATGVDVDEEVELFSNIGHIKGTLKNEIQKAEERMTRRVEL